MRLEKMLPMHVMVLSPLMTGNMELTCISDWQPATLGAYTARTSAEF